MIMLYGIKNCDTIKKAKQFLDKQQLTYQFHDYRVEGVTQALLETFSAQLGWQNLLNTRGTTWRQLPAAEKADINEERALQLMLAQPALIKRPVLVKGNEFLLGFSDSTYQSFFTAA